MISHSLKEIKINCWLNCCSFVCGTNISVQDFYIHISFYVITHHFHLCCFFFFPSSCRMKIPSPISLPHPSLCLWSKWTPWRTPKRRKVTSSIPAPTMSTPSSAVGWSVSHWRNKLLELSCKIEDVVNLEDIWFHTKQL